MVELSDFNRSTVSQWAQEKVLTYVIIVMNQRNAYENCN